MVISGDPISYLSWHDVEVVDLSNPQATCDKPQDVPIARYLIGLFIANQVIVCQRDVPDFYTKQCFTYDNNTNSWSETFEMNEIRSIAKAIQLSETEFWVPGGFYGSWKSTTEICDMSTSSCTYSVVLPEAIQHIQAARLNETHIFLSGDGLKSWLFDQRIRLTP